MRLRFTAVVSSLRNTLIFPENYVAYYFMAMWSSTTRHHTFFHLSDHLSSPSSLAFMSCKLPHLVLQYEKTGLFSFLFPSDFFLLGLYEIYIFNFAHPFFDHEKEKRIVFQFSFFIFFVFKHEIK